MDNDYDFTKLNNILKYFQMHAEQNFDLEDDVNIDSILTTNNQILYYLHNLNFQQLPGSDQATVKQINTELKSLIEKLEEVKNSVASELRDIKQAKSVSKQYLQNNR